MWDINQRPKYQPTTTPNGVYTILGGNVMTVWFSYLYPNDLYKAATSTLLMAPIAPLLPVHSTFGFGGGALVATIIAEATRCSSDNS